MPPDEKDLKRGQALTRYGIFVLCIAACGGMLFGYHSAIISGALVFLTPFFELSSQDEGMAVSILLLGGLFGALIGGFLSDHFGRKKTLLLAALLLLAGALIIAKADTFTELLFGRALSGFAIGLVTVVCPLYIGEISPPRYRGRYVCAFQLCIALGIFFAYCANYFFSEEQRWRVLFALGALQGLVYLALLFFIPESPSWSVSRGKLPKAIHAFKKVRRDIAWEENLDAMQSKVKEKRDLLSFFKPPVRHVLIVGVLLSIFQQITGINAVIFYTPKIFQNVGVESRAGAFLATLALGVVNFFATLFSAWILDKAGRRKLLLFGTFGMMGSLVFLSYAYFSVSPAIDSIAFISLTCYISCFSFSLGPVTWVVLVEIFPLKIRGNAIAVALALNWFANYVICLTFPDLIATLGGEWAFGIFAFISLMAFLFVYGFIPETKGKTLEQIETMVNSGKF